MTEEIIYREARQVWDACVTTAVVAGVSYGAGEVTSKWAFVMVIFAIVGRCALGCLIIMEVWPFRNKEPTP